MSATTIAVNDESPRRQYTASASQTEFDFPLPFFNNDDLTVFLTPVGQTPDDTTDLLTITTDYTVSGANTQDSGLVTLTTGATSGDIITIERIVDIKRISDFQNGGDLTAETINREQDTEIFIAQQLRQNINRGLRFQTTSATQSALLVAEPNTGKGLIWDANGNLINTDDNVNDIVSDATAAKNAAETAQASAEVSEAKAGAAEDGAVAAATAVAFNYTFSTTTTMADPGAGILRLNNATIASATAIAIDSETAATGNPDISDYIATWADTAGTDKGTLVFRKQGAPATFVIFQVTGVTDNTGWLQIDVTHIQNNGTLSDTDELYIAFYRHGDDFTVATQAEAEAGTNNTKAMTPLRTEQAIEANAVDQDSDVGAANLPTGTTADRPDTPAEGMFRRNSETGSFEGYDGASWADIGAEFSSQAENEAGTVEGKAVDPLGIREAFNATGSAPVYACRAWVNFQADGTKAVTASGNVSSITDNGTGDVTINFTNSLDDDSYAFTATCCGAASNGAFVCEKGAAGFADVDANRTVSSITIEMRADSGTKTDVGVVHAAVFR